MNEWLNTPDDKLPDWLRDAKAIINRMPDRDKEVDALDECEPKLPK